MADMEQYPQEWRQYEPIQPKGFDWRGLFRRLWAPIAAIGAFLAKFGVVLLKFKFLFSMFVSAAVYVWIGGWWFGIGLVVLLRGNGQCLGHRDTSWCDTLWCDTKRCDTN